MKRFLFLILLVGLGLFTNAFSQKRENKEIPKFAATTLPLRDVMGYSYLDFTGQWVEKKNVVSDMYDQYFNWIKVRTVSYDNENYYLLTVQKKSGYYKYPNLKRDYIETQIQETFFFTESEFSKLFDLTNMGNGAHSFYRTLLEDELVLETLPSTADAYKNDPLIDNVLQIKLSDEGSVRFLLPVSNFDYKDQNKADVPFLKNYFEITQDRFYKWLKPIEPIAPPIVKIGNY